jgi:hypothetical protein
MTITSTVDVSGIVKFGARLRAVSPPTEAKLRGIISEAGELVKKEADKRASAIMPHKAPKITVRVAGVMAQVRAEGNLGKLYEAGGAGGTAGSIARWRHPTFGHIPWVNQTPKPYLVPALHSTRDAVVVRMVEEINLLMEEYLSGVYEPE